VKFLKEPLLHFVLIGAAFFGLFSIVNPGDDVRETDNKIVVPAGRIEQLAKIYAKTWQRPPTQEERSIIARRSIWGLIAMTL